MEGWGSDFVAMEGSQRARPAEKGDHSIATPDVEHDVQRCVQAGTTSAGLFVSTKNSRPAT